MTNSAKNISHLSLCGTTYFLSGQPFVQSVYPKRPAHLITTPREWSEIFVLVFGKMFSELIDHSAIIFTRIGALVTIAILSLSLTCPLHAQESEIQRLSREFLRLYQQGNTAQAAIFARQAVEVAERTFDPDHPQVATVLSNLAFIYQVQGQYTLAEPLFKRSLAIREKALNPDHPDVATSLDFLAGIYYLQGQYTQAESLFKRSLLISEKVLGPDHLDVSTTLNNLGLVYKSQGRYAQAESLFKRSLAIYEKSLGPDHPRLAASLANLAEIYQSQGHYAQAEPLLKRSLAIKERLI